MKRILKVGAVVATVVTAVLAVLYVWICMVMVSLDKEQDELEDYI